MRSEKCESAGLVGGGAASGGGEVAGGGRRAAGGGGEVASGLWLARALVAGLVLTAVFGAGCAGPGPKVVPVVPASAGALSDGRMAYGYDTNGDGRADFREVLSADGRVTTIGYDTNADGHVDDEIELSAVPADEQRHLVIILDSVPILMAEEAWRHGRLRYFAPPTKVISPFPVMTDPALTEFFGVAPCPGTESEYFDGRRLTAGYVVYAEGGNTPWRASVDYRLQPILHSFAYLSHRPWFDHELGRIQRLFMERYGRGEPLTVAYVVGTSALGARQGRNGHADALVQVDRLCRTLVHATRGRVRITLLSDHGHNLMVSRRLRLGHQLEQLGYRVRSSLERRGDVVLPEFGMVTCAVLHTHEPARVAGDAVSVEGVELAVHRDGANALAVLSKAGRARIVHCPEGFRYDPQVGDPLQLRAILERLRQEGRVGPEGVVDDRVLFEATADHLYPDAVARLWRAFHGLLEHTPDVFLSIEDGWHAGSPVQSTLVCLQAAHGSLRAPSSTGMSMTMAGPLPPMTRMIDLRVALCEAGVPTCR